MRTEIFLAAALAFATAPAWSDQMQHRAAATMQMAQAATTSSAMTAADYVAQTSMVNTAEIDAGKLAERKSNNADVKAFAQMMITMHGAAEQKLIALAKVESLKVPVGEVAPEDAAMAKTLEGLSGAAFDRKYIEAMVAGHTKVLVWQKAFAADAKNPQMKSFAADMVKAVENHLEHAKVVAKKLGS